MGEIVELNTVGIICEINKNNMHLAVTELNPTWQSNNN